MTCIRLLAKYLKNPVSARAGLLMLPSRISRWSPASPATSSSFSFSRYVSKKWATVMPWMAFCMATVQHIRGGERTEKRGRRGAGAPLSEVEVLAEVELARALVVDEEFPRALGQHSAGPDQVGPVHDPEDLAHVVVGDDDADPPRLELEDDLLDFRHRDGVDRREGLVHEEEMR